MHSLMTIFLLVYASVTLAVWTVITAVCIYGWQRTRHLMDVGRPPRWRAAAAARLHYRDGPKRGTPSRAGAPVVD